MFKSLNHNNRLFLLGNFLFALSYGLWMNLRQLHLLALRATPAEIGTVFAVVAVAGGLLPLPAGILADRIGPKRIILGAWAVAVAGALTAALAQSWPLAAAGYLIFTLCIAANPATVSYVLLNTPDRDKEGNAERVMATAFISYPVAMVFAPALGGLITDHWSIQADLWLGAAGLLAAVGVFALADDSRAATTGHQSSLRLAGNRSFVSLAVFFTITLVALYLGYALVPTYLRDARGHSAGSIGILFSLSAVGMLLYRIVIVYLQPRSSFAVLVGLAWLGMLGLWRIRGDVGTGAVFVLLGAITATWVVMQASIGRAVPDDLRGLALGITEALYAGGIALASWLAGQLYGLTPAHDLPLLAGSAAILVMLILWELMPLGRQPSAAARASAVGAHGFTEEALER